MTKNGLGNCWKDDLWPQHCIDSLPKQSQLSFAVRKGIWIKNTLSLEAKAFIRLEKASRNNQISLWILWIYNRLPSISSLNHFQEPHPAAHFQKILKIWDIVNLPSTWQFHWKAHGALHGHGISPHQTTVNPPVAPTTAPRAPVTSRSPPRQWRLVKLLKLQLPDQWAVFWPLIWYDLAV